VLAVVSTDPTVNPTISHTTGQEWRTTYGRAEITVVEDRAIERVIKFVVPTAQMPDTLDKKAITDVVLTKGEISLAE
jgi:hypothetical protein